MSMFRKQGFKIVAPLGKNNLVMRRSILSSFLLFDFFPILIYTCNGRARRGTSGASTPAFGRATRNPLQRGRIPSRGTSVSGLFGSSGVESWVRRGRNRSTPPGPEGSNGTSSFLGAVGSPDRSRLIRTSRGTRLERRCTTNSMFEVRH